MALMPSHKKRRISRDVESAVLRTDAEDDIHPDITKYLNDHVVHGNNFFGVWDWDEIYKNIRKLAYQDRNECVVISKSTFNSSSKKASQVNTRKRYQLKIERCTDVCQVSCKDWEILVYVWMEMDKLDTRDVDDFIKVLKKQRQRHERVIMLIDFAMKKDFFMRINRGILEDTSECFMEPVLSHLLKVTQ
jgi:hypothetical protein